MRRGAQLSVRLIVPAWDNVRRRIGMEGVALKMVGRLGAGCSASVRGY